MTLDAPFPSGESGTISKRRRICLAVALFYFGMGLCFASWASRIPDIKTALGLNDAHFGTILFAMPVGQFLMMPFSGKLVTRFGSSGVLLFAVPAYTLILCLIGLVSTGWQLAMVLFLFGLAGNMCNISINTQGVTVERWYGRQIMASFHGSRKPGGLYRGADRAGHDEPEANPLFSFCHYCSSGMAEPVCEPALSNPGKNKSDHILFQLGVIAFCSMASEGAMFDWSGIYFKDVVKAPASLVILGYTSFMVMMATGRFLADYVISEIGRKRLLQICGMMISAGLFTAVIFPNLITATIAFMIVGLGVSGNIPTVYSAAGRHPSIPPGMALATVGSVGFLGFLMGPPLIGYISQALSLRYSFAVMGLFGLGITFLVSRVKALN
jgi:MFS family permease